MKRIIILLVLLALLLSATSLVMAQYSGGTYSLIQGNMTSGGGTSQSSSTSAAQFTVQGSIGQVEVHEMAQGGVYSITGGIWGVAVTGDYVERPKTYLPIILRFD
jgi:opacity protein-like surface antigen